MVLIKSLEDFELFKQFPIQPICYAYYKGSLALNVHYVGFTTQHGYKYLKNHHKMKRIKDVLNQGYYIQIYTKYNENSLIKLLNPSLNKIAGIGICGRTITRGYIHSVGEICGNRYTNYPYNHIFREILIEPIPTTQIVSIPKDLVWYVLEKKHNYTQSLDNTHAFYQNEYISHLITLKPRILELIGCKLFEILMYCKIKYLYMSFVIVHKCYLDYAARHAVSHVERDPNWKSRVRPPEFYLDIHIEILSKLYHSNCLTFSIIQKWPRGTFGKNGPSYYYREALTYCLDRNW